MSDEEQLRELRFTVSGRVTRPCSEVYEAVADPEQLSRYFTTGGAQGRLEAVTVVEADPPRRLVIRWAGQAASDASGQTTTTFEFEPIDDGARTLVTITESSWQPTEAGAKSAFGNCEGWTGMLAALKVWLEHGINLREGFYA